MTCLTTAQWERLIVRWSPLQATPEVCLLAHVMASAIAGAQRYGSEDYALNFAFISGQSMDNYCAALQLDSTFMREQIERANTVEPEVF